MVTIDYNELSLFTTPLGEAVQKENIEILLGRKDSKTERALYISKVNNSLTSIAQGLIKFADPNIKSFKMTRIDRGDYLKYHFENYFFRLPKLKDQVLQLLNVIFQLDYNQSNGLEKKIRNTKILQEKELLYFLDYFNVVFSKIKPLRDTIAHRGDLVDRNFAMLTSYSLVKYDIEIYNSLLKGQISYTYIFKQNQGILKQAVITLLLVLYDDFNVIIKSFEPQ